MADRSRHLSEKDMLLLLDNELPQAQSESMRTHLAACQECSSRVVAKRHTLDALGNLFARDMAPSPLAHLRLAQELSRHGKTASPWRWPMAAAASFLLVAAGIALYTGLRQQAGEAGSVPNLVLTPGAIRPVTLNEICSKANEDDDLDPAVPATLQNAVFQEYGIAAKGTERNYQIDYLVNPQLGGTDDIRNLWPQSYQSKVWNARAKDQLEERLHQMVCSRTIDLATAQREITTDWIAAYKKYVQQPGPRV